MMETAKEAEQAAKTTASAKVEQFRTLVQSLKPHPPEVETLLMWTENELQVQSNRFPSKEQLADVFEMRQFGLGSGLLATFISLNFPPHPKASIVTPAASVAAIAAPSGQTLVELLNRFQSQPLPETGEVGDCPLYPAGKFFVREWFPEFLKFLTERSPTQPLMCVSGSPGIGKSAFGIYAAHRLAAGGARVCLVLQGEGQRYQFVDGRWSPCEDVNAFLYDEHSYAIIDTQRKLVLGLPPRCRLLYISSPALSQLPPFREDYYAPPWTLKELRQFAERAQGAISLVPWFFETFGGIARYAFVATSSLRPTRMSDEEYLTAYSNLLSSADTDVAAGTTALLSTFPHLEPFMHDIRQRIQEYQIPYTATLLAGSHHLLLMHPTKDHQHFEFYFASRLVRDACFDVLLARDQERLYNFLSTLSPMERNRGLDGILFETYVLRALKRGGTWSLTPHTDAYSPVVLLESFVLPRGLVEHRFGEIKDIDPGSSDIWIPKSAKFPAIDSLIPSRRLCFQMTIRADHPIEGGTIKELVERLGGGELHIVFVIPPGATGKHQRLEGAHPSNCVQYSLNITPADVCALLQTTPHSPSPTKTCRQSFIAKPPKHGISKKSPNHDTQKKAPQKATHMGLVGEKGGASLGGARVGSHRVGVAGDLSSRAHTPPRSSTHSLNLIDLTDPPTADCQISRPADCTRGLWFDPAVGAGVARYDHQSWMFV
ncbi:hypothetical protein PAPYR_7940 [Paratrimastix pyriformis]|uniref:Uncharacterized protein n=1 Tax=Paratrimastix pyriformis TaxID=342808 RepID=A0ABQ8UBR1_9EUKA|nr:hypothetical protein PAPYR_7940 [Paratrimastix pyriformis]